MASRPQFAIRSRRSRGPGEPIGRATCSALERLAIPTGADKRGSARRAASTGASSLRHRRSPPCVVPCADTPARDCSSPRALVSVACAAIHANTASTSCASAAQSSAAHRDCTIYSAWSARFRPMMQKSAIRATAGETRHAKAAHHVEVKEGSERQDESESPLRPGDDEADRERDDDLGGRDALASKHGSEADQGNETEQPGSHHRAGRRAHAGGKQTAADRDHFFAALERAAIQRRHHDAGHVTAEDIDHAIPDPAGRSRQVTIPRLGWPAQRIQNSLP